jgi:hypothetical protein
VHRPGRALSDDVTGPPDASLEVAPPVVQRRDLLVGGGLGLASMVLPSASVAASTLSFGPQPFTYGSEDRTVAAWLPFDSGDASQYAANAGAGVQAKRVTTAGLTAFMTQAGSATSVGKDRTSVADPELSGMVTSEATPTFGEWAMRASGTTLDLVNAPHLRFTITVTKENEEDPSGSLTLTTLVLHSVQNMDAGSSFTADANLAAYVGVNGGAAVLRRTVALKASDAFRHIVINLGLSQVFEAGDTVVVSIYPYAMAEAREVHFAGYFSDPAPVPHTAGDTIDEDRVTGNLQSSGTEENGDGPASWMAAFIGTYTEPPEPESTGDSE